MVEVKNKKTQRSYFLTKEEWESIAINGKKDKYELVGEAKKIITPKIKTPIPDEVKTTIKKTKLT